MVGIAAALTEAGAAAQPRAGSCGCRARDVMVGHVLRLVAGRRGLARYTHWQMGDRWSLPVWRERVVPMAATVSVGEISLSGRDGFPWQLVALRRAAGVHRKLVRCPFR